MKHYSFHIALALLYTLIYSYTQVSNRLSFPYYQLFLNGQFLRRSRSCFISVSAGPQLQILLHCQGGRCVSQKCKPWPKPYCRRYLSLSGCTPIRCIPRWSRVNPFLQVVYFVTCFGRFSCNRRLIRATLSLSRYMQSDTVSASIATAMRFKSKGQGEPVKKRVSVGGSKEEIPDSETFQDLGLFSLIFSNQNGHKVRHHTSGWVEPCIASGPRQQVKD